MNGKVISTLYKKEMTDLVRDKKTMIIMLFIPLVLYPLLVVIMLFLTTSMMDAPTEKDYPIAIVKSDENTSVDLKQLLLGAQEEYEYHFIIDEISDTNDIESVVREKSYKAIINPKGSDYEVLYLKSDNDSTLAAEMIEEVIEDYKDKVVEESMRERVDNYDELVSPFSMEKIDCSTNEESTGMLIGMIIPFLMVESTIIGAFYSSMDITAGERERGTLETLITMPVRTKDLLYSKFLATTTMALFSILINALSVLIMGIVFVAASNDNSTIGEINVFQYALPVTISLIALVLFALFTSACCLCFFFFAKTYKEANTISTPIMLVFIFLSIGVVFPDCVLSLKNAWIPVLNVSLLIKEVFLLEYDITNIVVVMFSTVLFTVLFLFILGKIISSEDILFGSGKRHIKLFEKRGNLQEKSIPGYGDLLILLSVGFLLMIYAGSLFLNLMGYWSVLITQLVIFLIPAVYSWYIKADVKKLFSLKAPRITDVIGTVLIFVGAMFLEQIIVGFLMKIIPSTADTNAMIDDLIGDAGFVSSLLVVGILPAIAEETLFRGFVFGTVKNNCKKYSAIAAILVSALLFGVYHMNLLQSVNAFYIGLLMAYIVYKTGSIYASAIFHLLNNSFSVVLTYYPAILDKFTLNGVVEKNVFWFELGVGLLLLATGILVLNIKKSKRTNK